MSNSIRNLCVEKQMKQRWETFSKPWRNESGRQSRKLCPTETKTVIVSPDGELSFVSFATLLTPDDRFLGEKYSISYVASGRDLLRENKASGNPTTVVFANPDFGQPGNYSSNCLTKSCRTALT